MNSQPEAIVIGASAGALGALSSILPVLPKEFDIPIFIVVHLPPHSESLMASLLQDRSEIKVLEAEDKEPIIGGRAYIAPPDYHLMVENKESLSLSNEEEVHFSRPSIDVLFESAASIYGENLMGILLTGANDDGARGLAAISKAGGGVVIENPETAEVATMPLEGMKLCPEARILDVEAIGQYMLDVCGVKEAARQEQV